MMNQLKKLILSRLLILPIQSKKTDYDTKIEEIEKKRDDKHDKYITTQEFNKLATCHFAAILKQANLARENDYFSISKQL